MVQVTTTFFGQALYIYHCSCSCWGNFFKKSLRLRHFNSGPLAVWEGTRCPILKPHPGTPLSTLFISSFGPSDLATEGC